MNTTDPLSLAQIMGYAAFAATVWAHSQRRDGVFLWGNFAAALVWIPHFYWLGSMTGVAVSGIIALRSAYAATFPQAWHRKMVSALFIGFYLLFGWHTATAWHDWLPIAAGITATLGMILLSGIALRAAMIVSSLCWGVFAFTVHSYGGLINEIVLIAINGYNIYRLRRDGKAIKAAPSA